MNRLDELKLAWNYLKQDAPRMYEKLSLKRIAESNLELERLRDRYKNSKTDEERECIKKEAHEINLYKEIFMGSGPPTT